MKVTAIDHFVLNRVSLGLEGFLSYSKHGSDSTSKAHNVAHVGARGRFAFSDPREPVTPFASVGLGVYLVEEPSTAGGAVDQKRGARFGGSVGFGFIFKVSESVGFGLESDYIVVARAGESSAELG